MYEQHFIISTTTIKYQIQFFHLHSLLYAEHQIENRTETLLNIVKYLCAKAIFGRFIKLEIISILAEMFRVK